MTTFDKVINEAVRRLSIEPSLDMMSPSQPPSSPASPVGTLPSGTRPLQNVKAPAAIRHLHMNLPTDPKKEKDNVALKILQQALTKLHQEQLNATRNGQFGSSGQRFGIRA